jgi:hypothetical protein
MRQSKRMLCMRYKTTPTHYLSFSFELNSCAELSQEHQVKDDGCREERILTGIVQHDGILSTHKDLRGIFIHSPLTVSHIGDVLKKEKI